MKIDVIRLLTGPRLMGLYLDRANRLTGSCVQNSGKWQDRKFAQVRRRS